MVASVAHVTPAVFGARGLYGGAERYVHAVAKALRLNGIRNQKIIGFTKQAPQSWDDEGIEVQLLPTDNHAANQMEWFGRSLWEALLPFEIVHIHQAFTKCGQAALIAANDLGKCIIATDLGGGMPPVSLADHPARLASRLVAISEFSASLINNDINIPIDIISGPVDPYFTKPLNTGKRLGALFVGRLLPHKGVDRLISAAPKTLKVTVAGTSEDDGYIDFLRTLAKGKNIDFIGAVANADLPGLYESASIHVAPSVTHDYRGGFHPNSELMGLTTIEALCRGTPVAVANTCSLPLLIDQRVGRVYQTPKELTEILEQVDSREWSAMYSSNEVRAFALARFAPDVVGSRMLQSYQSASGHK